MLGGARVFVGAVGVVAAAYVVRFVPETGRRRRGVAPGADRA
jgi:hypothetical protein